MGVKSEWPTITAVNLCKQLHEKIFGPKFVCILQKKLQITKQCKNFKVIFPAYGLIMSEIYL